jgi:kinesin family protein 3/17
VRVRPPLSRELGGSIFLSTVEVDETKTKLQLFEYYNIENLNPHEFESYMDNPNNFSRHNFTFDQVYDDESTQE